MNPINVTRRHILRAALAAGVAGIKQDALEDACRALQPALLGSDFRQALRELEGEELLEGITSCADRSITWGLTGAGELLARRL
ncbi:MAG: hypothetical protein NT167_22335 [Verrucomicrobia bacterium]|nr:hypothetical protein [Verrucomicrobiota bacterium]